MTSKKPFAGSSGMKLGGFGLIGAGALAAVLGMTTIASGGSQDSAQPLTAPDSPPNDPAAPSSGPDAPKPSALPSPGAIAPSPAKPSPEKPDPAKPIPGTPPPAGPSVPPGQPGKGASPSDAVPTPGPPVPPGVGRPAPTPGDSPQDSPRIVVRVYNNSTIKGLAHRAAEDFRRSGYDVPEVGNYAAGRIYTTTVYFRPGTEEEPQATEVARRFNARLEPRFEGLRQASPGVIAIVTNDYKGSTAR